MTSPTINGYEIQTEISSGSAGSVYKARRQDGVLVAIKVFDRMASNPKLIRSRMQRLIEYGTQNVTVPIFVEELENRPAYIVMPLLGEVQGDGAYFVPRTLQSHLTDYMVTEKSWPFVLKLAQRMAALHTARVAHGNLKPGNLFLDEDDAPLISDYATGLMPGVYHLGFSDALLYAPPEQLRSPEAYLEEVAYRWDVFAFGVIAFRLLTGQFPRCQDLFAPACPAAGDHKVQRIEADYEEIASGLEEDERLTWPNESLDKREEKYREMIDFCLMLDPQGRPADMREVFRRFERIKEELAQESVNLELVKQRKQAEKRRYIAVRMTKVLAVITLGLAVMWGWTQYQRYEEAQRAAKKFNDYESNAESTIASLEEAIDAARQAELNSRNLSESLREALASEQKNALEELRAAQMSNERLMRWVLEKGVVGMPILEGRVGRLAVLGEEIEKQAASLERRPGLEKQAAILRYRHAEVLLSSGQDRKGEALLQDAILKGKSYLNSVYQIEGLLRICLMRSSRKEAVTQDLLNEIRALITKNWPEGGDQNLRYSAVLDLVSGRQAELDNQLEDAQKSYASSLKSLEELTKRYPETPALRMGLGRAYQEAAISSESAGDITNTAVLREKAAAAFLKLAADPKTKSPELEFQIASAKAAQAIAAWQNGRSFTAETMAREGVAKLTAIQKKMPNDFRVATTLASQHGIMATVLRDQGNSTQATSLLIRSINTLEIGLQKESTNWNARYLLASLKWQLSGIYGQKGSSPEEVKLGIEARDQLKLILDAGARTPHPNRVRASLAYLCGDLGHSADLSGRRSLGIDFMKESKQSWENILASHPKNTEAREGVNWVTQRLREMGVK